MYLQKHALWYTSQREKEKKDSLEFYFFFRQQGTEHTFTAISKSQEYLQTYRSLSLSFCTYAEKRVYMHVCNRKNQTPYTLSKKARILHSNLPFYIYWDNVHFFYTIPEVAVFFPFFQRLQTSNSTAPTIRELWIFVENACSLRSQEQCLPFSVEIEIRFYA